ncbi:hypothetical protein FHR70_001504 [Microvirga lupini]|uniref:DUF465 domain-containing protein n=1 Tax=Microvirga lupini TaxID=420324 RepID=A0A7W4VKJ9_9HYPH|nr:hypothetical protein [Microvirga lupini]MBB3018450.1 hypothetical protein [Microvirga lupini]
MADTKFHKDEFSNGAHQSRIYSPTFQPLLQSLLATLADLDFDYEKEREKLSNTSPDTNIKIRALEKLKTRHRERREPYIQQLAILQKRMMELRA